MSDEPEATPAGGYWGYLRHAPEALSEGCCPICAARLEPRERRDGIDFAGYCDAHQLFEIEGRITSHTMTFLPPMAEPPRIPYA